MTDCRIKEGCVCLWMFKYSPGEYGAKLAHIRDVAWREVMDSWREEAGSRSKLVEVRKLIEKNAKHGEWK